jgi:hypothetical protein
MDKGNLSAAGSGNGFVMYQPNSLGLELRQYGLHVIYFETDVMQARPALGEESGHPAGAGRWLHQLEIGCADRQHRHDGFLPRQRLSVVHGEAQGSLPETQPLLDVGDDNRYVVNVEQRHLQLLSVLAFPQGTVYSDQTPVYSHPSERPTEPTRICGGGQISA